MEKLIDALDNVSMDMRNLKEYLQGVELPSREARSLATDVGIYGSMTVRAMQTLSTLLAGLEDAKTEAREAAKEEKGGEVPSKPVREPEDGPPGGEAPIQEPGPETSEGD